MHPSILDMFWRLALNDHQYISVSTDNIACAKCVIPAQTILGPVEGKKCYICEVDPDTTKLFYIDTDAVIDASLSSNPTSYITYAGSEDEANVSIVVKYTEHGDVNCFFVTTRYINTNDSLYLSIYTVT